MGKLLTGLPLPVCRFCGKGIKRPRSISIQQWQMQQHCNLQCKMAATKRAKGGA